LANHMEIINQTNLNLENEQIGQHQVI
jgi:hypothetical protein